MFDDELAGLWTSRVDYLANITGQFNIVHSFPRGRIVHHSQVPISSPGVEVQLIDRRWIRRPSLPIGGRAESPRAFPVSRRRQYYDGDR